MRSAKTELRLKVRKLRHEFLQDLDVYSRQALATLLARQVTSTISISKNAIISGYWPLKDEIDPRPLLEIWAKEGHEITLPAIITRKAPLIFRLWKEGDPLEPGPYKSLEPCSGAKVVCPDIVLVPLHAFDLQGNRLGQGAGYYDRTLEDLRKRKPILAVGIAFEIQKLDSLPVEPHDQPLDLIVTEKRAYRVKEE